MKNIFKISMILTIFLSGLFAGCSEDFLDISNENELDADIYFTKIGNLDLALNGVYSSLKTYELYGADLLDKILECPVHTDDQDWLGTAAWNQLATNEVTADNGLVANTWRAYYRTVARANDFITNANIYKESEFIRPGEEAKVDVMLGQAHMIRAFAYFSIVRLWGEGPATEPTKLAAPLILKVASTREEMETERATVGAIYDQVIADLKMAESMLPDSWDGADIARVDKYAAKGYLGKVYLYKEDWENAKTYLGQIVNGPFDLVAPEDYDGLFHGETEFSTESIWELNFQTDLTDNTWDGGLGTNIALMRAPFGTGWSNVWPHDENIKRFGDDPRLRNSALEPGVDEVTFGDGTTKLLEKFPTEDGGLGWSHKKYVPLTYSVYSTNRNYHANFHLMRLADVYLMYAEALNASGGDTEALEFVNKVRRRAYGKDHNTPDSEVDLAGLAGTELRDAIREERFLELFGEGQRWFDVVRWGIAKEEADKYVRGRAGLIVFDEPKDNYLPIPLNELEKNPNMTPSTGYSF